jgi:hypothetical protein
MLTFFPAVGQRKYDYTKKQVLIVFLCGLFAREYSYSKYQTC